MLDSQGDAQGWYVRRRWRLGKWEVVVVRVTSISTRLKPWGEWAAVTVNVPSIVESLVYIPLPQRGSAYQPSASPREITQPSFPRPEGAAHTVFYHVAEDLVPVCDAPTGRDVGGGWITLGIAQGNVAPKIPAP